MEGVNADIYEQSLKDNSDSPKTSSDMATTTEELFVAATDVTTTDKTILTQHNLISDLFDSTQDVPNSTEDFFAVVPDTTNACNTPPSVEITATTNLDTANNTSPIADVTVDNTPTTGRPKRAANARALENIRAILEWEHCSKGSRLFKSVETQINGEFDSLNKKRSFADISDATVNGATVVEDQNSMSEGYDTDQDVFNQASSDDDDDDYSIDSFIVSDSAELEYNSTSGDDEDLTDECSDDVDHDDVDHVDEDLDHEDTNSSSCSHEDITCASTPTGQEETSSPSSIGSTPWAEC